MNNRVIRDNHIPIILSSDDTYAIYIPVLLKSIYETSSRDYIYEIFVLDSGISEFNKCIIANFSDNHKNFHISFIDVNGFIEKYSNIFVTFAHFSPATYVRFFIPELFPQDKKVLYLDIDLLVKSDISELYNLNIDSFVIAAAVDACFARQLHFNENDMQEYTENILELPKGVSEFNAGVLLINLENWERDNITTKCIQKLKEIGVPRVLDQCVLNAVIDQDKIYQLPIEWNYVWHAEINNMIPNTFSQSFNNLINEYKDKLDKIKIVHYTSPVKPWNLFIQEDNLVRCVISFLAIDWWRLAVLSDSYTQILFQNNIKYCNLTIKNNRENGTNQINLHQNSYKNEKIKIRYTILGLPLLTKMISNSSIKFLFLNIPILKIKKYFK